MVPVHPGCRMIRVWSTAIRIGSKQVQHPVLYATMPFEADVIGMIKDSYINSGASLKDPSAGRENQNIDASFIQYYTCPSPHQSSLRWLFFFATSTSPDLAHSASPTHHL